MMDTGLSVYHDDDTAIPVYEGDVLFIGPAENLVVVWNHERCQFQLEGEFTFRTFDQISVNIAVHLGNIFENPSLSPIRL